MAKLSANQRQLLSLYRRGLRSIREKPEVRNRPKIVGDLTQDADPSLTIVCSSRFHCVSTATVPCSFWQGRSHPSTRFRYLGLLPAYYGTDDGKLLCQPERSSRQPTRPAAASIGASGQRKNVEEWPACRWHVVDGKLTYSLSTDVIFASDASLNEQQIAQLQDTYTVL